jgi:hypothetical protein
LHPAVRKAEVPLLIPGFGWWNADLCFAADGLVRLLVVDVSVVNLDSATSRRRTASSFADVEYPSIRRVRHQEPSGSRGGARTR